MKTLRHILGLLFFISNVIAAAHLQAASELVLESIEAKVGNDMPEQVVFKLNGSHTPKSFRLDGDNPRLVFDFYGVKYPSEINRISDVGGNIIAGIRIGRHYKPPKIRVVVDIQKGSPYLHEQTFNVSNNNLVITFNPDTSKKSLSRKPSPKPPRIVVDSAKVVHTSSQMKPESEPPASDATASAPTRDGPLELAATPPEKIKEPITPSPAAKTDSPPAPLPPVQPKKPGDTEQPAQVAKPEQPAEPPIPEPADVVPVLLDVSFEKSINESETVLFRLNHFYPPLVFGIEKGEPRVVCDFFDAEIDEKIPPVIEADGQFVDRILVTDESDPDKVRVELVLMPNRNYDLQQLFFKEDNLFVVIVKEVPEDSAAAN